LISSNSGCRSWLSPAKLTFASNSAPVAFNKRIPGGHRVLRCDGQQCRLADACLTGEQHRPAFADGSLDERGEPLDVYLSSDELALITTFHRRLLLPAPAARGPPRAYVAWPSGACAATNSVE
jgi:hypothetical protein